MRVPAGRVRRVEWIGEQIHAVHKPQPRAIAALNRVIVVDPIGRPSLISRSLRRSKRGNNRQHNQNSATELHEAPCFRRQHTVGSAISIASMTPKPITPCFAVKGTSQEPNGPAYNVVTSPPTTPSRSSSSSKPN